MATQDQHADGDEEPQADEIEDLDPGFGLMDVDPLDPLKREQRPGESQPGLDPTLPPIPPS